MFQTPQKLPCRFPSIFKNCTDLIYADGEGALIYLLATRTSSGFQPISFHSAFLVEGVYTDVSGVLKYYLGFFDIQADKSSKAEYIHNIRSMEWIEPIMQMPQVRASLLEKMKKMHIDLDASHHLTWTATYEQLDRLRENIGKDQKKTARAIACGFLAAHQALLERGETPSSYFAEQWKIYYHDLSAAEKQKYRIPNLVSKMLFGKILTACQFINEGNPEELSIEGACKFLHMLFSSCRDLVVLCLRKLSAESYLVHTEGAGLFPFRLLGSQLNGNALDPEKGLNCTQWCKWKLSEIGVNVKLGDKNKPDKVKKTPVATPARVEPAHSDSDKERELGTMHP